MQTFPVIHVISTENTGKKIILIKEVIKSLPSIFASGPQRSYLRKENRISKLASKDVNKSVTIVTFQKNNENSHNFQHHLLKILPQFGKV